MSQRALDTEGTEATKGTKGMQSPVIKTIVYLGLVPCVACALNLCALQCHLWPMNKFIRKAILLSIH